MRAARAVVAVLGCALLAVWPASTPQAQESPVLKAMADELTRSMQQLRLPDQPAPYYIEYEVEERIGTRITARLGALVEDLSGRGRTLRVGVRVGDYAFDSSLFNTNDRAAGLVNLQADGSTSAPLDEDYDSMRRQIWLATDVAYKRAVSTFARKRAAFQNRVAGQFLPDFSREKAEETMLGALPSPAGNRDWLERAKLISAVFTATPVIDNSEVSVADTRGTRYYLNSEGSRVVVPIQIASIRVSADARAADGMTVRDVFTVVEKSLQDLPAVTDLLPRARDMVERLKVQRTAPWGEEYTGPVLVEGQASGEIVAQALAPALLGRRPAEAGGGRGGRGGGGGQVTPFLARVRLRVLTEDFSVSDTPSLKLLDGKPVPGAYLVDEHGIRAKDVELVEKGRLVTLLAGRAPLKGLPQSSGHTRGGDVQPGVLQMRSSEAVSAAALKRRYLDLLDTQDKEFGYIVRAIASPGDVPGGGGGAGPVILQAVKVTRDGRETPVRGLRLGAVPPAVFRDLLEASKERTLHSYRVTTTDAASVIVPNLIFEELEIQRTREITQRPPAVPSPLAN